MSVFQELVLSPGVHTHPGPSTRTGESLCLSRNNHLPLLALVFVASSARDTQKGTGASVTTFVVLTTVDHATPSFCLVCLLGEMDVCVWVPFSFSVEGLSLSPVSRVSACLTAQAKRRVGYAAVVGAAADAAAASAAFAAFAAAAPVVAVAAAAAAPAAAAGPLPPPLVLPPLLLPLLGRLPLPPSPSALLFLLLGAGPGVFFSLLLLCPLRSPDLSIFPEAVCVRAFSLSLTHI